METNGIQKVFHSVFAIIFNLSHSTERWTKNDRLYTRKQLAGRFVICPSFKYEESVNSVEVPDDYECWYSLPLKTWQMFG
jgi:hypothetical protein